MRLLALLTLLLVTGVIGSPIVTHTVAAGFTLVGRVDGGVPSGQRVNPGDTLIIVSDDSGTPVRYVIDLRWVLDSLGRLDQDDLVSVEVEQAPRRHPRGDKRRQRDGPIRY